MYAYPNDIIQEEVTEDVLRTVNRRLKEVFEQPYLQKLHDTYPQFYIHSERGVEIEWN